MSISLATKFAPYTDEIFKAESKLSLLTNTAFDWVGAHTVKIYKVSTVDMNDYARNVYAPAEGEDAPSAISRYGDLYDLSASTEEMLLTKDRSFIFNVDKMDTDETAGQVEAASALARQLRNVVVPEVDAYVYGKMVSGAGTKPIAKTLSKTDIYDDILAGSEELDNNEVPETERVLIVVPEVYTMLKQADVFDSNDIGADLRIKGVVGMIDGMVVVKVPAARLPENFGFMIAHPAATVAPVKLEDYSVHHDTVLSSGDIVTGRVVYDAFVLDNKAKAIYYQAMSPSGATGATGATGA